MKKLAESRAPLDLEAICRKAYRQTKLKRGNPRAISILMGQLCPRAELQLVDIGIPPGKALLEFHITICTSIKVSGRMTKEERNWTYAKVCARVLGHQLNYCSGVVWTDCEVNAVALILLMPSAALYEDLRDMSHEQIALVYGVSDEIVRRRLYELRGFGLHEDCLPTSAKARR